MILTMLEEQVTDHSTIVRRWVIMLGNVLSQRKAKEKENEKEKRKEGESHRREVKAEERKERQGKEERHLGATQCN